MVIGFILLFISAIVFFFGFANKVSMFFGNDVVMLLIILATFIGNIIPPLTTTYFTIYYGTIILVLTSFFLMFSRMKAKEILWTLLGFVIIAPILYFYKSFVIDKLNANNFIVMGSYIAVAGLASYIAGRNPLSVFLIAIFSVVTVDVIQNIINLNNIGVFSFVSPSTFDYMIASSFAAVVLHQLANAIVLRIGERGKHLWAGEAADEIFFEDERKNKKNGKKS